MNKDTLKSWLQLTGEDKRDIFNEVSAAKNLPHAAIEKDWWVVRTLEIIFESSIHEHTVFKGGTSLSKAWGLIDRFSEDIDLALDRRYFGFDRSDDEMNGSQISKLRRHSFKFISDTYLPELEARFSEKGLEVSFELIEVTANDNDPLKIAVYYKALTDSIAYLIPRVIIEVGSRSLVEPFEERSFSSFVGEHYAGRLFADHPISIPTVLPERTFLEKIFLLHEEFQQPIERVRVDRRSRHMYDLEKLMDTEYAERALRDTYLYQTIVTHRKHITPIRGINYANHVPANISIIPPADILVHWEDDYREMRESMFYNPSLTFGELVSRLLELKARINFIEH